jgi:outer membrane protein TolC
MFKTLFTLFGLIPAGALCAAEAAPARLDWPQVQQAVREQDPALASARADAAQADAMAMAAYAWMPPQLQLELMGLDAVSPDFSAPMQRKWSLTEELPFPGRTWAQGRVASHLAEAMRAGADMAERRELKAAWEAYSSLAAAEYLQAALDKVGEATGEMAKVSQRRAGFGQLDRMGQFMDAMLGMEDGKVDAMRPMVAQQHRAAEATLQRLMGLDPFKPLPSAKLDLDALLLQPLPSLADALKSAESHSPELRMAQAQAAAAAAGHGLALSGWLPDLMLSGNVTEDAMGQRQAGAMLGVSLPWLWFWKQAGEAAAASSAADKAAAELQLARLKLREQVLQAHGDLLAATEALRLTLAKVAPKAAAGLELARSGFRTTALGPTEILMAVQDYRMTQEQVAQLIAQWGAAKAMLTMLGVDADPGSAPTQPAQVQP